jgi:drug/metabolite transporter (DMT)-like permease
LQKNLMATADTKPKHQEHIVLGMTAGLGAFLMFSVMFVFAKLLSDRHSVIEIAFYRNLIASMPFLFMAFVLGDRKILVIRSKPTAVALRAVLGSMTIVVTFAAYSLMPMADTQAILFASSLFIPVMGVVFLKERVGPWRWSAVLAGFAGVVVILRPSGDVYTLGIAVALTAAVMQAVMQVVLRYLGGHEEPKTVTLYFFVIGTLVMALPLPFVAVTPTWGEIPLLFGVGLTGAVAQWLLSTAFRNAPAAVVSIFNYSGIIWATAFGWLIWNDWPLPAVFIGAAIVIASNVLIIWRESRLGRLAAPRAVDSG